MTALAAVRAPASRRVFEVAPVVLRAAAVELRHRGGRGVGPVDLTACAGEVVALVGPNGAGKTTLLRVLAGVSRAQRGEVRWFETASAATGRAGMGLALDVAVEEESWSGRQSTYFWCRQWIGDAGRARHLTGAALRRFGLDGVADEPVGSYSFGMRRRLAVAQALAHEPPLALLDEPSAGLDPDGLGRLCEELARRRECGATSVLASNDPGLVARVADRVALLDSGVVVRCDTPAALLATAPAERVVELRLGGSLDVDAMRAVAGVVAVDLLHSGACVRFGGAGCLARIVAAADSGRSRVVGVRVREPDLGDVFLALTGRTLVDEAT